MFSALATKAGPLLKYKANCQKLEINQAPIIWKSRRRIPRRQHIAYSHDNS